MGTHPITNRGRRGLLPQPPRGYILDGTPVTRTQWMQTAITEPPPGFVVDRKPLQDTEPEVDISVHELANEIGTPDYTSVQPEQDALSVLDLMKKSGETLGRSTLQVAAAPGRLAVEASKIFPHLGIGYGRILEHLRGSKEAWLTRESRKSLKGLERIKKRLTFVEEGLTDTAMSMALGGGAGAGTRKIMEMSKPMAALARQTGITESLLTTGVKSGLVAAAGDKIIVDPALQIIDEKILESDLSPQTKQLILSTAPLLIGLISGATIEAKMDRLLKNPLAVGFFDSMAKQKATPEEVMRKFKDQDIDAAAGFKAQEPPEGFVLDQPKPKISKTKLAVHPATVTGPIGAISGGIDWQEYEKTGRIKFDPKKALLGAVAGTTAGIGFRRARRLGKTITEKWDKTAKEKIIEPLKDLANGMIVNEDLRHGLGLNRSPQMQEMLRTHLRDVERTWNFAAEVGKELQTIAPTKLEQKRLYQIMRGSITASPQLQKKAEAVRKMFSDLREKLGEYKLLEYSRFDKLTRKQRARLRSIINHPKEHNATPYDTDRARSQLHDHYHFASAQEYAPVYYKKWEGLTPHERSILQDEIDRLKIKSRRGNPEGRQTLEAMISDMEGMLATGTKARRQLRKTRNMLNKAYSHRRIEMPIEAQRMLGMIDEASFPVAKMIGVQKTDVLKGKLFQSISEKPEWFIPSEAKLIDPPANFVKISDERFGLLDGGWLRKDIASDLADVEDMRGAFIRNWDKTLGLWKYGKVILNPATHARNFMSNMVLAYFGDVNPADIKTYNKAFQAMRKGSKDKFYREAEDWGLFNNTFVSSEITKLRDELESLRDPKALRNWLRKASSLPAELYQSNEKLFKMAVFIKAKQAGASVDNAARKAEKYIFNYADIPPWVKQTKRWLSPFFTFTYKAVPLFGEMLIRKPWKVAAIMAAMYGMEEFSKHELGISKIEAETERIMLPDWQKRRVPPGFGPYTHVLMPWADKWGNHLYLDLAYILPYGNLAEKWGQSAIPLADLLPSNPLFQVSAAILTNTRPFTGKPIYNEVLDGAAQITAKYLDLAWKEAVPSMAPGGFGFNKLKTGIQNTFFGKNVKDWADRPLEFQTAVLSSLFGIKLSPANEKKLKQFEFYHRKRISKEIGKEFSRLKIRKERNEISKDEFNQQSRELLNLKKKLFKTRPKINQ